MFACASARMKLPTLSPREWVVLTLVDFLPPSTLSPMRAAYRFTSLFMEACAMPFFAFSESSRHSRAAFWSLLGQDSLDGNPWIGGRQGDWQLGSVRRMLAQRSFFLGVSRECLGSRTSSANVEKMTWQSLLCLYHQAVQYGL